MSRHLAGVDSGHRAALAQHGDGVGDGQYLGELVVDEDDGVASGLEFSQVPKQFFDLLGNQHSRWLVQDQDPGSAVEHFDDLDPLAFTDFEGLHQVVGMEVEAVRAAQFF